MDNTPDIVERLKSLAVFMSNGQFISPVAFEATAQITALRAENERLRAGMNNALRRNLVTDCHHTLTAALTCKPNDKWCQCANNFVSSCVCTAYLDTLAADPEAPMTLQPVAPAPDEIEPLKHRGTVTRCPENGWYFSQELSGGWIVEHLTGDEKTRTVRAWEITEGLRIYITEQLGRVLAPAPVVTEWSPIETAPKDRPILTWGTLHDDGIGEDEFMTISTWTGSGWFSRCSGIHAPRLWHPAPAAPKPEVT
jgi:hypothetical protein